MLPFSRLPGGDHVTYVLLRRICRASLLPSSGGQLTMSCTQNQLANVMRMHTRLAVRRRIVFVRRT